MTNAQKIIALYEYEDRGGQFLSMKTLAWAEHRLIVSKVEWIEKGVSVRLCNRPAEIAKPNPGLPSERPWGVTTGRTGLWVPLQGER